MFNNCFAEINPTLNYNQPKPNNKYNSYYTNTHCGGENTVALNGMQIYNSPVSKLYFSKENTARIQKMIKKDVYNRTEGAYVLETDQDSNDLLVAMRAVYLEHADHLLTHFVKQVKKLNMRTIEYIVPDIVTNIKQHYGYLKEINSPLQMIPRPLNVHKAGRKTLPSVTTIFWNN
jgi:hypothetical protein